MLHQIGTPMILYKIRKSNQQINDLGGMVLIADLLKNSSLYNFTTIISTRKTEYQIPLSSVAI